ncbi:MAG: flagellar motor switch protein FliG [Firmicutes bacterium]|nr:flagellar motor switch protein FliG [Bacillota bacterium]
MAARNKITGIQKSAILMITLGPDISSSILKKLPDKLIQKITYEIANIDQVKPEVRNKVLEEFMDMNEARNYISQGGLEYARNVLTKALGNKRAKEIIDTVSEVTQQRRPFAIARKTDSQQLLNTIMNEHPQTIALILCYLQADKAASILSGLPEELQTDVADRIATMSRTSPLVIEQVEKILEKKLSSVVGEDLASLGGVSSLVDILNQVDRGTEKVILEELEKDKPDLADEVRNSMFVFEDIILLDNTSIQRVIREVENSDLALALKGASEDVSEIIFKNVSKRAGENLKDDIEFMGPVRLVEVEQAQQKIVGIIRRLEEAGEIIVARGGDDGIVL